jgi:hypothetical protein
MGKWPVPSLVVIHWISVKSCIEAEPDRPQPLSFGSGAQPISALPSAFAVP